MKTFEFLNLNQERPQWEEIEDKGYADKKKSGVPCRIVHENGSWKVIANVEAVPEGYKVRFKSPLPSRIQATVPSLEEALENLAKTGQTVLPA